MHFYAFKANLSFGYTLNPYYRPIANDHIRKNQEIEMDIYLIRQGGAKRRANPVPIPEPNPNPELQMSLWSRPSSYVQSPSSEQK